MNKSKDTLLLLFIALVVIGGMALAFIKPQWKSDSKPSQKVKNELEKKHQQEESQYIVPTITAEEVKSKLDDKDDIVILDVQRFDNYLSKHIPSSINIPLDQLEKRKEELPKNKEIIVTCYSESSCKLSTKAAETLLSLGFDNIKDFKDGVTSWEEQNYPTVSGQEVTYKNINTEQLKEIIDSQEDITILDIRNQEDYIDSHIKGAIHIPFEQIAEKIKELPRNEELIIYDKTGHRSKLIVEMLTEKGFTQAINLIDGFTQWQNSNYPTE